MRERAVMRRCLLASAVELQVGGTAVLGVVLFLMMQMMYRLGIAYSVLRFRVIITVDVLKYIVNHNT